MTAMEKLERKFGKRKGPNLMMGLIIAYAVGYLVTRIAPAAFEALCFNPYEIFRGQVWRLVTFLVATGNGSFFLTLLMCFVYFSIGRALEAIIGRFRLNFFLVNGILLTILFGFLYYFILGANVLWTPNRVFVVLLEPTYLYSMLFVLFALSFPDAQFLLMFFIPVKGRWMIYITMGFFLIDAVSGFINNGAGYGWILVFMMLAAILDLVLYLLLSGGKARKTFTRRPAGSDRTDKTANTRRGPLHGAAFLNGLSSVKSIDSIEKLDENPSRR